MNHLRIILALLSFLFPTAIALGQGCSTDINGDGKVDGGDLALVLSNWGTCPPSITSVTPIQGSVLGGTVITITGTGLSTTVAVTVGGTPCTAVTVLSPTQVRATTPPGAAGQAAIAVTTPAGTSLAPSPFNYVLQSVTSISPSSGPYTGGTPITISGQYLSGTNAVTIGGVPATNLVVVNSTTLTAVTPAGSVGTADVVVSGSKGTVSLPMGFSYLFVSTPSWSTLLEAWPDPSVVTNATLRNAIIQTGYAWRVRDKATGIEMVLVPPSSFYMGCSASNAYGCGNDEFPVHLVGLTTAFYIGRYEVTQAQWTARMGSNPSYFQTATAEVPLPQVANRPVEQVSWGAAGGFLAGTGLRLPTEAEWEYACRAGTTTAFHGWQSQPNGTSDDLLVSSIAWFGANSIGQTRPVGEKAANGFGLHDMSGNVWEWASDYYESSYYASSPPFDPTGPGIGFAGGVFRGGAWNSSSNGPRSSNRGNTPDDTFNNIGFRVARNP